MQHVIVIGAQWGDEGKGKIVDWLCERADIVVRFQGGHNAGHTLVVDGVEHRLHMLPSGVIRPELLSVIGSGTVVEPWKLLEEIDACAQRGVNISPKNLAIAENTCMVLPHYATIDSLREAADRQKQRQLGTTRRGIGVAYEDKTGRRAIRVCDLQTPDLLRSRLRDLTDHHNPLLIALGAEPVDPNNLASDLLAEVAPKLLPYVRPVWRDLYEANRQRKRILFEGAQGVMLDVDHGTYPFVTSSNTVAGQAGIGTGLGLGRHGYVLGITKCYTTRVGEGPFPSEQVNNIGEKLGRIGKEWGVTTQRKRRCGWFDAVLVRQSCIIGGVDGLALTKLDVLDEFPIIRLCIGYRLGSEEIDYLPANSAFQQEIVPIYEDMEGWQSSTRHARSWRDLPAAAVKYVRRIEELVQTPVSLVSTSPERQDTITVKDPFAP